jgi:hypothetical protein
MDFAGNDALLDREHVIWVTKLRKIMTGNSGSTSIDVPIAERS